MESPDYDTALPDPGDDRIEIECRTCEGSGETWVRRDDGFDTYTCGTCGGSGVERVSEG